MTDAGGADTPDSLPVAEPDRAELMRVASRIAELRHHRESLLGPTVCETAWDLLLAIFARGGSSGEDGGSGAVGGVRIRDLVAASRHHSATTIRTVMMLEEAGRITISSAGDRTGTRTVILTPATVSALEAYLRDMHAL